MVKYLLSDKANIEIVWESSLDFAFPIIYAKSCPSVWFAFGKWTMSKGEMRNESVWTANATCVGFVYLPRPFSRANAMRGSLNCGSICFMLKFYLKSWLQIIDGKSESGFERVEKVLQLIFFLFLQIGSVNIESKFIKNGDSKIKSFILIYCQNLWIIRPRWYFSHHHMFCNCWCIHINTWHKRNFFCCLKFLVYRIIVTK